MSLRGKILFLFLFLAIAPLLAVAGSAYVQSQRAITDLMEGRIVTLAAYAAQDLAAAHDLLEGQLGRLAGEPALRGLLAARPGTSLHDRATRAAAQRLDELWPFLSPAVLSIAIRGSGGELLHAKAAPDAEHTSPCADDPRAGVLSITRIVESPDGLTLGRITGAVSARLLVRPEVLGTPFGLSGVMAILDRDTRTTVPVVGCDALDAAALLAQGRGTDGVPLANVASGSAFAYRADGTERLGTFVDLEGPPWTVVMTAPMADFLGPFRELQNGYALFVALVALSTALAFSLSINQVMRSLEDLGDAADRIGRGELDPWLPPPSQDEVGRLSYAIGRMAERIRQMVRQVDRSSRMAVVGELASYLAHEIRNPLSSIKLNLQSLSREVDRGRLAQDARHEIGVCLKEVARLDRVVSSVLKLGNARPGEVAPGSVNELLAETLELTRPELKRAGVRSVVALDAAADTVRGDFAQLKGVFLNLILNAADAMPDGGCVHVRTENDESGQRVVVHVVDEGPGIPQEFRERVFEPFFTTKNHGSGIGLSLAVRAVEDHGGRIYLSPPSDVSQGAHFVVELPLAHAETGAVGQVTRLPTPSREADLRDAAGVPQATKDP